jgi:hypothetical protein
VTGQRARRAGRARFVLLHLRARNTPLIGAGLVAVALLAWAAAHWLVTREFSTGARERWPVAALAPLLGGVLVSVGFAGADEELERTAAVRWRPIRLLQVMLATAAVGAALALTGLWEPRVYGAFELVRNTAAVVGAVALAAAVLGARLAWVPVASYVLVVMSIGPRDPGTAWWTWPVQPWASPPAVWSAATLLALGGAAYACVPGRSRLMSKTSAWLRPSG